MIWHVIDRADIYVGTLAVFKFIEDTPPTLRFRGSRASIVQNSRQRTQFSILSRTVALPSSNRRYFFKLNYIYKLYNFLHLYLKLRRLRREIAFHIFLKFRREIENDPTRVRAFKFVQKKCVFSSLSAQLSTYFTFLHFLLYNYKNIQGHFHRITNLFLFYFNVPAILRTANDTVSIICNSIDPRLHHHVVGIRHIYRDRAIASVIARPGVKSFIFCKSFVSQGSLRFRWPGLSREARASAIGYSSRSTIDIAATMGEVGSSPDIAHNLPRQFRRNKSVVFLGS